MNPVLIFAQVCLFVLLLTASKSLSGFVEHCACMFARPYLTGLSCSQVPPHPTQYAVINMAGVREAEAAGVRVVRQFVELYMAPLAT